MKLFYFISIVLFVLSTFIFNACFPTSGDGDSSGDDDSATTTSTSTTSTTTSDTSSSSTYTIKGSM